jgi:hypothetical protein
MTVSVHHPLRRSAGTCVTQAWQQRCVVAMRPVFSAWIKKTGPGDQN